MTAKEQLLTALDFVGENEGENEAAQILAYAKQTFVLKKKTWDDVEDDEPTADEIAAFEECRAANSAK
jgi:hypothetical protein